MVNFGSSWCSHCHAMLPPFLSLAKRHPGVQFAVAQVDYLQVGQRRRGGSTCCHGHADCDRKPRPLRQRLWSAAALAHCCWLERTSDRCLFPLAGRERRHPHANVHCVQEGRQGGQAPDHAASKPCTMHISVPPSHLACCQRSCAPRQLRPCACQPQRLRASPHRRARWTSFSAPTSSS